MLGTVAAAALIATSWSHQTFTAGKPSDPEPVVRAAIGADGHTLAAWSSHARLVLARDGRLKVLARVPADYAVAPAALVYEAKDGVHSVVGGRDRLVTTSTGSEINGVAIAADPLGGWAVAERTYPPRGGGKPYRVRAFTLDPRGALSGPVQDLGEAQFGVDARITQPLVVKPDGTAVLAIEADDGGVLLATRPHGGTFAAPEQVAGANLGEPRVTLSGDTVTLSVISQTACGDAGCAGSPLSGEPLSGPNLRYPSRAFAPWATPEGMVFLMKDEPRPFSREAPVRLYTDGRLRYLTREPSTEPVALALPDRTLALWTTRARWGAALVAPSGSVRRVAAPPGHAPSIYHSNATNRDARSAGRWVIVAWARGGIVHLATRRF